MEDLRSKSCRDGRMMQIEEYKGGQNGPTSMQDMRSYSVSYGGQQVPNQFGKEVKIKKGGSRNMGSLGSSSSMKNWSLTDPELQRKKRVASYKVYTMEGKMKGSFRKSFKWIKDTYTNVVYGWR
ncbi:hypothetical protein M5689_020470 [Euphorbia peplus]|nr:hypothetical protein M5689_020470 [Euphorbia peplus]